MCDQLINFILGNKEPPLRLLFLYQPYPRILSISKLPRLLNVSVASPGTTFEVRLFVIGGTFVPRLTRVVAASRTQKRRSFKNVNPNEVYSQSLEITLYRNEIKG